VVTVGITHSLLVITYAANSYCSQANRLRQYSTVCRLMIECSKHVVAITSEEKKKNCCVDGPIIALFETYNKVHIGKHLSDSFPIQNGLKQGDAFITAFQL
jgi:hypothetical protein